MITAIFDLDGTIADTIQDLSDAVNYGLHKLGCPEHDLKAYKKFVGNGAEKLCYRALPDDRKSDSENSTVFSVNITVNTFLTIQSFIQISKVLLKDFPQTE